jgi:hypothetical protein
VRTFAKILLVLVGLMLLVAIGIGSVFWFSRALPRVADAFFAAVRAHDNATAASHLSSGFKAATDEATLANFLAANGLTDVAAASWPNRKIATENGVQSGRLEGSVTLGDGRTLALKIGFVKEGDAWKIQSIDKPAAGLLSDGRPVANTPPLPGDAERTALVKQSMHDFFVSARAKDMAHFYSTIAPLWQKQTSADALAAAFKQVLDLDQDWSVVESLDPVFDAGTPIADDGTLSLGGRYATHPSQVFFKLRYVYESGAWKLIGFNIDLR